MHKQQIKLNEIKLVIGAKLVKFLGLLGFS